MSKRIMLTVSYDGTRYHGWQIQDGQVTVESVLNEELSRLLGENIEIIGASRTDAGVHAMGNVAVFDTESRIPPEKISYALNNSLPEDIIIQSSREVPSDFHPRKTDCNKTYEYKIWNADFIQPFNRRYTHFVHRDIDVDAMKAACGAFIGEHDFTSFCSVKTQVMDHVRTIYSLEVIPDEKDSRLITIRVKGNGFLYNMVRIIAGTLIEIGEGRKEPDCIAGIIEKKDRYAAGPTAPAKGLTLVEIRYPELEKED